MNRTENMPRFEKALNSESPRAQLSDLARQLRDEGVSQLDLFSLYEHYQLMLQEDDSNDPKLDAVLDTMDIIWGGPWAKGWGLYPHELTSQEVAKYRASQKPSASENGDIPK